MGLSIGDSSLVCQGQTWHSMLRGKMIAVDEGVAGWYSPLGT